MFPLYVYRDSERNDLLSPKSGPADRKLNLSPSLLVELHRACARNVMPEEILHYLYAVLYAPNYRTKCAEFLRTDFPRVPFTRNPELFAKAAHLGKRLVDLHLLKSPELDPPLARLQPTGGNKIEKPRYSEKQKRVYINEDQYFEGVEPAVWTYQIGGYQVLEKWLKDRKGRTLSLDDIRHYCHVVTALARTIEIQKDIDVLYPEIERDIIMIGSLSDS